MAVYKIVIFKNSSLFCEKWLSDRVISYSEHSALNTRFVRQIIRDMAFSLTLIGNRYFTCRK